ncbi:hypothetical protein ACKTEK_05775 [Tepidamorphus sp. 3E244]|uniref:hypothetical protein n=1 Tax=Tepidamorphus sp. 3E244 TaxID=3385498 RepID=UPI0038FC1885
MTQRFDASKLCNSGKWGWGLHMRTVAFLFFLTVFVPTELRAQWVYQKQESAFGSDSVHLALAAGRGGYALGIRCTGGDSQIIYITPEKMGDDAVSLINSSGAKLLLRVDEEAVVELDPVASLSDGEALYAADLSIEVAQSIIDARKRVAVAVSWLSNNFHENSFTVRGSTKAVGKILENCQ